MQQSGPTWREVLGKHQSAMAEELAVCLNSDLQDAVAKALATERASVLVRVTKAAEDARRGHAEVLNQALRRLRQAASEAQILALLHEIAAPFASQVVVVSFENSQDRAAQARVLGSGAVFPVSEAAALVAAIESRDPVVAIASEAEVSAELARQFRGEDEEPRKAYLFPVVSRQAAAGVVIASGNVSAASLELLCEASAMRMEAITVAAARVPEKKSAWKDLDAGEQKLHLQAQRMARVRVAEMRIYHEEAWQRGVAGRDIYGALKTPLSEARQQFLQTFLARSTTMVDYLHLEILKTLAADDDRLLGPDYPGPMV